MRISPRIKNGLSGIAVLACFIIVGRMSYNDDLVFEHRYCSGVKAGNLNYKRWDCAAILAKPEHQAALKKTEGKNHDR